LGVEQPQDADADAGAALLALYDRALPEVYGYLARRCGAATAEDLTAETFLAAVSAIERDTVERMTVAWLVTVARNKLVDHWRRVAREERNLALAADAARVGDDDWTDAIDAGRGLTTLARLGAHHQAALTLRYVDALPVAAVAEHLNRTVHATEALLVRARVAFRRAYEEGSDDA
jgi:RNA polymerase sigma-70 factor (ECF subfamily)